MRVTTLILIILFIVSCKYRFENKKVVVDEKVTEWRGSDEPPSTELCDKFVSEEDRINCFKTELSAIIFEQIDFSEVKVKMPLDDTLKISIMIDKSGKVSYLNSIINTKIKKQIPKIDSMLSIAIANLPKVFPATKTDIGVQVDSKFEVPIIIKTY